MNTKDMGQAAHDAPPDVELCSAILPLNMSIAHYTLAYVSTNQVQDGKFRKMEGKVRDTKAVVNTQRG
jgi:hypothetical protein